MNNDVKNHVVHWYGSNPPPLLITIEIPKKKKMINDPIQS